MGLLLGTKRSLLDTRRVGYGTAYDQPNNTYNADITGCTLGQTGIGDGATSFYFDGANDRVALSGAVLTAMGAALDGDEGTLALWLKVYNAAVWTDGNAHMAWRPFAGSDDELVLVKAQNNGQFWWNREGGGVDDTVVETGLSPTDWFHITMTWSVSSGVSGELKAYRDGVQRGSTQTGLSAWTGTLTQFVIGARNVDQRWYGWIAKAAIWCGTVLGQSDITDLASV